MRTDILEEIRSNEKLFIPDILKDIHKYATIDKASGAYIIKVKDFKQSYALKNLEKKIVQKEKWYLPSTTLDYFILFNDSIPTYTFFTTGIYKSDFPIKELKYWIPDTVDEIEHIPYRIDDIKSDIRDMLESKYREPSEEYLQYVKNIISKLENYYNIIMTDMKLNKEVIDKKSLEAIVDKSFDPISQKIDIVDKELLQTHIPTIPTDVINEMFELLNESNKDDIEYLAMICSNHNIELSKTCKGEKKCVNFSEIKCEENQSQIGLYHTHPNTDYTDFSLQDLLLHLDYEYLISCVGADNKIECLLNNPNLEKRAYFRNVYDKDVDRFLNIERKLNANEYVSEIDEEQYFDYRDMIRNIYLKAIIINK